MGEVRVALLGGFAAEVDGVPVGETAWRLRKARELVKLLALAPDHRLHREQVMDLLWRDRPPAAAANNLHQAVHVARRTLRPDAIEVRDETLTLVADVDVNRLQSAAVDARRAGTAAAYREALSLYGGELLPENRYDDWVTEKRDELAVLADQLKERLEALGSSNDDLRRPLPAEASSFIGRSRELIELRALVRGTRLLTLAGPGGAGKTRLALELARRVEAEYSDGASLVQLAAVQNGGLVPTAVAAAFDVRALSGQKAIDGLIDFLTSRSFLMVLDNCEHLLAEATELADLLLRSAPRLTIVATSREPLRLPGEVVFRVPSLDIPDPERTLSPDELMSYEAVRLFVERANASDPGFALDQENAAAVARICFRLDGLPLALELAAGRLGALTPTAVAERLDDRFRLLRRGTRASPTRQHTLTATLDWSHDLLEPGEQTLFRRLGIFAGAFELAAVETVCSDPELGIPEIADVLARLVEKSLVAFDDTPSNERRYRLLETVRAYARHRLDDAQETSALAERHAQWALTLAESHRNSPRLDRDAPNLRAALDTLLARAPSDALRLCIALWPSWLRRIDLPEAHRRFDVALAGAPARTSLRADGLLALAGIEFRAGTLAEGLAHAEESLALAHEIDDPRAEWRALQFLGEFGVANDSADMALPWLRRALELARREGFAAGEAICVYSLGVAYWILGDLERAEDLVAQSLDLFRGLAGSTERIMSPVNIAEIRTSQAGGRPGLRVVFEDTLQPFVEISCDAAVSYVLANRAGIVRARGDLTRAHALLDESAARFALADDDAGRAAVLVRLAYLELAEDRLSDARTAFKEALALRARQSDRRGLGLVLAGLGLVDTMSGDHLSAERNLTDALEIFRRAGDRWGLAGTLWRVADLACARGDLDAAERALQEARLVLDAAKRQRWIANTIAGLAEVAVLRGDENRARELFIEARGRYASRDDALGVAEVDDRLRDLAKGALRDGKVALDRTDRSPQPNGAGHESHNRTRPRGSNRPGAARGHSG